MPELGRESASDAIAAASADEYLLDVREPDEWAKGHAESATSIPMSQLADRVDEIPTDRPIHIVCRSGARSTRVGHALVETGRQVVNVEGGMQAWVASGGIIVSDNPDRPIID